MKSTTAINLVVEYGRVNNCKGTAAYRMVMNALLKCEPVIRPCRTSGKGRFTRNLDYTVQVFQILDECGIRYFFDNDAPRGGLIGNYIKLHVEF